MPLSIPSSFPSPFFTAVVPNRIPTNGDTTIEIQGSYFIPEMAVASNGFTTNRVIFDSDNKIFVDITVPEILGKFNLTLDNGAAITIEEAFEVIIKPWTDLRSGSGETLDVGTDVILSADGLTFNRDSNGVYFTIAQQWRSIANFEKYKFTRGSGTNVEILFNNAFRTTYMIGIGKNPRDTSANPQFYQVEYVAYFLSNSTLVATYGAITQQTYGITIPTGGYLKLKFTNDVVAGSAWFLFRVAPTTEDNWDDESELLVSSTIESVFQLSGAELFPVILPSSETSPDNYIVAFRFT